MLCLQFLIRDPPKTKGLAVLLGYMLFVFAVSFINYAAVLSVYFDMIKCYLANEITPAFCENPSAVQIGLINHATWAINTAADCLMVRCVTLILYLV